MIVGCRVAAAAGNGVKLEHFRGNLPEGDSFCSRHVLSFSLGVEGLGAKGWWKLQASRWQCMCHIWGDKGQLSALVFYF